MHPSGSPHGYRTAIYKEKTGKSGLFFISSGGLGYGEINVPIISGRDSVGVGVAVSVGVGVGVNVGVGVGVRVGVGVAVGA
jgi:hypothetical protein